MHVSFFFFFYGYGYHRDLHVLTHSFPTRRSSDLQLDLRFDKRAKRSRREIVDAEGDRRRVRGAGLAAGPDRDDHRVREGRERSEEHTSELQSLMRISYAVFCLKKKNYRNESESVLRTHPITTTRQPDTHNV